MFCHNFVEGAIPFPCWGGITDSGWCRRGSYSCVYVSSCSVAWNTQVPHILASCSANGSTIIWDLRQKKPWCELRDAQRGSVTDIAWNPDEGQNIVTASGNDDNPVRACPGNLGRV